MSIWRPPTPITRTIQALLLHENIFTAIATYNNWEYESALCGGVTNAFIEQLNSDDSSLTLLTQLGINGVYYTGRTIGNSAYIATTATVDTWSFTSQLDRYNYEYNTMTAVQYEAAAYNIANTTVAKFAKKIMDGLGWKETGLAWACKHIIQISSFTNQNSRYTA